MLDYRSKIRQPINLLLVEANDALATHNDANDAVHKVLENRGNGIYTDDVDSVLKTHISTGETALSALNIFAAALKLHGDYVREDQTRGGIRKVADSVNLMKQILFQRESERANAPSGTVLV